MPLDVCAATYKILIIGDASVGKTALLRRLMGKEFQLRLYPTIGSDFISKVIEVDGALVELQIWDTAGQERFNSFTRWQYRGAQGIVMVYDITDVTTFTHLAYWLQSVNEEVVLNHNKYEAIPIVLLGNKCDLEEKRQVQNRDGKKFADKELLFEFMETSALTGENVFQIFKRLAIHVTEIFNPELMKSYHRHMIREPVYSSPPGTKPSIRQSCPSFTAAGVGNDQLDGGIVTLRQKSKSTTNRPKVKSSLRHSFTSGITSAISAAPVIGTKKRAKRGGAIVKADFRRNLVTIEYPMKKELIENGERDVNDKEVKTVRLNGRVNSADGGRSKCCRPC